MLTFITALIRLTTLMKTGTKAYGEIQENMPAAARLFAVLNQESRITDRPSAPPCPRPEKEIGCTMCASAMAREPRCCAA